MEDWKEKTLYEGVILVSAIAFTKWMLKTFKEGVATLKKKIKDADKIDHIEARIIYNGQYLKAIVHLSESPMYLIDVKSGDLEDVNPAWCELLGFSNEEDAHGMGFMLAIPEEDIDRVLEQNDRFTKHPSNLVGLINFQHIKTKEKIVCLFRNIVLDDVHGKPEKALGILKVISS